MLTQDDCDCPVASMCRKAAGLLPQKMAENITTNMSSLILSKWGQYFCPTPGDVVHFNVGFPAVQKL